MQSKLKSFLLPVFAVSILMMACSTTKTNKILPFEDMKYFYQISEGDKVEIDWDFENAHRVKVEGFAGSFLPKDRIFVRPDVSTEYKIIAYKGFSDSLVWTVYVEVLAKIDKKKKVEEIQTGASVLTEQFTRPSYQESEFLNGIISENLSTGPDELRIVRVKRNTKGEKAEIYALLLDKLGNFVSGYGNKKDSITWNTTNSCAHTSANYSNLSFTELSAEKLNEYVDFAVLIDNSCFATNDSIKKPLRFFLTGMNSNDKILVSIFNHRYLNIFKLMPPETALFGFDDMFILPKSNGFNASNDAMINTIKALDNGKNRHRALVLITYSNDNASFNNNFKDVIRKAVIGNVAVYVIGIGDNINANQYRALCAATGGKYYILLNDEIEKFTNVLSEILFTYRNSYQIHIPLQNFGNNCQVSKTKLSFTYNDINLKTSVVYPAGLTEKNEKRIYTAGFEKSVILIDKMYYDNLNRIAQYLKKQAKKFFLTGYGFDEWNKEISDNFAELRAEAVKNYLVNRGVSPDLLVIRSQTGTEPLFTFTENKLLLKLNRRVELTPYQNKAKRDYELLVAFAPSEVESQKIIQKWEKRGYNAYYERTRTHNGIAYKVKLWGFKSENEAVNEINKIKKKYKEYIIINK
jgi:outer membrane protein OmpA-like peptidoglycan-associated protein